MIFNLFVYKYVGEKIEDNFFRAR
ncbi:MAG: hypothetical protein H6Q19_1363, partial [Bacteroidetes bacterium]|nr:hypothetical protein [Bacteroidota bacterium]